MEWVQHINLEKEFIANIITIEGNTFDKSDVCNEGNFTLVRIAAVADCKGTVDGKIELTDIGSDCRPIR